MLRHVEELDRREIAMRYVPWLLWPHKGNGVEGDLTYLSFGYRLHNRYKSLQADLVAQGRGWWCIDLLWPPSYSDLSSLGSSARVGQQRHFRTLPNYIAEKVKGKQRLISSWHLLGCTMLGEMLQEEIKRCLEYWVISHMIQRKYMSNRDLISWRSWITFNFAGSGQIWNWAAARGESKMWFGSIVSHHNTLFHRICWDITGECPWLEYFASV